MQKGKPLAVERKNAHNFTDIQTYFPFFQSTVALLGMTPNHILNIDEIGFRVSCGLTHLVVILLSHKRIMIADPDNRVTDKIQIGRYTRVTI